MIGARNVTDEPDPTGQVMVDRHGYGTHVAATIAGTHPFAKPPDGGKAGRLDDNRAVDTAGLDE